MRMVFSGQFIASMLSGILQKYRACPALGFNKENTDLKSHVRLAQHTSCKKTHIYKLAHCTISFVCCDQLIIINFQYFVSGSTYIVDV